MTAPTAEELVIYWQNRHADLLKLVSSLKADAARLDYIERTFSGMTNRERYLPVQMIWGKGAMGRTLREACDKYMLRDATIDKALAGVELNNFNEEKGDE